MSDVTVYWMQGCGPCGQTKRWLEKEGVEFDAVELKTTEDFENLIHPMGYKQVPVVVAGEDHWSGFRINRLKELVK